MAKCHHRMQLAPDGSHHHFRGLKAPVIPVHMGILMVGNHRRGAVHHPLRNIGVEVQRGDHRHIGANNLSHGLQNISLAVLLMLSHHGTVQSEQHAIDLPGSGQVLEKDPLDLLKGLLRHISGGFGRRGHRKDPFGAIFMQHVDKSAHGGKGVAEIVHDVLSCQIVPASERIHAGFARPKSIGLVRK